MEIKVLTKKDFLDNQEFLKKHLGKVFNYDDFEELKAEFPHKEINVENFEKMSTELGEAVFNGHKNRYALNSDMEIFWVMACDENGIYSLATFEKYHGAVLVDGVTTRLGFRRRGLSEKVLRKGLSLLKNDCVLHVEKNNEAAKNLYKKLGFETVKPSSEFEDIEGNFFMIKPYKENIK